MVAGLFIFNKELPRAVESCRLSCSTAETPSHAFLHGNKACLIVGDHPLISAVEVNYLPSNDPNEVRSVWRLLCSDRQRRYDMSRAVREE